APCSGDGHGSAVSLPGYTGSRAKWEVEHGLAEAARRGPQERQEGDRRREEEADDRAHAEEDTKCAGQAGSSGREAQAHRRNFAEDARRAHQDRAATRTRRPFEDGSRRARTSTRGRLSAPLAWSGRVRSSAGESAALTRQMSQVRVLPHPPNVPVSDLRARATRRGEPGSQL